MIVFRTSRAIGDIARLVQAAILETDPALTFPVLVGSETLVRKNTQGQRWFAGLAGSMGILALLLSAIGIYGVVAFSVTRRTREIGLRMAVGATRPEVLRGILRDAVCLAVPGLLLGGALSAAVAAALRSALYGLSPMDPVAFATATGALFLVVLLAGFIPARRASAIDPMAALRKE
jgi:ABC-type antimicrobial peptide transport system permease subunit